MKKKIKPGTRYYANWNYVEKKMNIPHKVSVVAKCDSIEDAVRLARRLNKLDWLEAQAKAARKRVPTGLKNFA